MQVGTVDDAVGIAVGRESGCTQRHPDDFLAGSHVVHAQARRKERDPIDGVGQAQVFEHLEDVGAELDAGADLSESSRLLQHRHLVPVPGQDVRRGETADTAAGYEEVKRLGHGRWVVLERGKGKS